ncbi:ATP-binding protein [Parabacteroides sp. FAFU027]|uniref:ATP-binding protein n=1 Tax=Parabacteroides sp. FAFU027 TaxID=2922715 RepID=UPI001FAFBB0A|nr:ATP-binding protein [Parabacteroides sp. FAFU027]
MILESTIAAIIEQQKSRMVMRDTGLKRELVPATQSLSSHALIVSGIRRCGKSTLLMQMMKEMDAETILFLNFETPQLFEFSISDFARLDNIINRLNPKTLFFDELQLIQGWEMYVRQKLDEGFQVVITGSNASLLSKELGTRLTGRHITQELFPFSYSEYLRFKTLEPSPESLKSYLQTGGFPEYLKSGDDEQLATLFEDILIRDIVARYGIKDMKSLHRLANFLVSNIGNRITASKLKQPLSIGATSTILTWFSHLELSYLVSFLPMFSHSTKAQLINPRKVYAIDMGLVDVVSTTMTEDWGRKLENLVFLHLRIKYQELYYFDEQGECDFVAIKRGAVVEIVQVCYALTPDNLAREVAGLVKAMRFFDVKKARIVTFADNDFIQEDNLEIEVIPAFKYLLE